MLSPRWRKALRDLWLNRTRTALVVAAMAIGIFGIAAVADAYAILPPQMTENYPRLKDMYFLSAGQSFRAGGFALNLSAATSRLFAGGGISQDLLAISLQYGR